MLGVNAIVELAFLIRVIAYAQLRYLNAFEKAARDSRPRAGLFNQELIAANQ